MIDYVNKKKNNKQYISEVNEKFKNIKLSDMDYSVITIYILNDVNITEERGRK